MIGLELCFPKQRWQRSVDSKELLPDAEEGRCPMHNAPRGVNTIMPPKKANGRKRSKDPRENKSEAMRQVIGALGMDAPITEIQDMLLNKFGHTMSANMVSSYRSTLRQGKGKRKKKGRR